MSTGRRPLALSRSAASVARLSRLATRCASHRKIAVFVLEYASELLFVGDQARRYPAEPLAFLGGRARWAYLSLQDRWPARLRRRPVGR